MGEKENKVNFECLLESVQDDRWTGGDVDRSLQCNLQFNEMRGIKKWYMSIQKLIGNRINIDFTRFKPFSPKTNCQKKSSHGNTERPENIRSLLDRRRSCVSRSHRRRRRWSRRRRQPRYL